MENKDENKEEHKGLADNHRGDFILNESGTSVSIGLEDDLPPLADEQRQSDTQQEEKKEADTDALKK